MRDYMEILGQRLKSDKMMIAYVGSPLSGEFVSIPPGQPSPEITGYILQSGGYFAVKGSQEDLYIKDTDQVRLVDPSAPDDSTFYARINATLGSFFHNTTNDIDRYSGYVSDGFQESVDQLKVQAFDVGSWIKQAFLVLVAFLVIILISKWL